MTDLLEIEVEIAKISNYQWRCVPCKTCVRAEKQPGESKTSAVCRRAFVPMEILA